MADSKQSEAPRPTLRATKYTSSKSATISPRNRLVAFPKEEGLAPSKAYGEKTVFLGCFRRLSTESRLPGGGPVWASVHITPRADTPENVLALFDRVRDLWVY